jgi:hypothetical protein
MSEIRSIGLAHIKLGAIANDGGMGQSLSILGVTYQDTADLTQEDPEITNIMSEENDEPEEVIEVKGAKKLKFSIMNFDPDVMVRVLGGTSTGSAPNKIWSAPIAADPIELSIDILTKRNVSILIPRAKITAKLNMQFRKKGVTLIDIVATILTPTKNGTLPMTIQALPES